MPAKCAPAKPPDPVAEETDYSFRTDEPEQEEVIKATPLTDPPPEEPMSKSAHGHKRNSLVTSTASRTSK